MNFERNPRTAKPDAKLMAIVLFPQPPFALMTVMMFMFVLMMAGRGTVALHCPERR
jgi:hypothetical protein